MSETGSPTPVRAAGTPPEPLTRRRAGGAARRRRAPARAAFRAAVLAAATGPFVGLLWWFLAPGGARTAGTTYLDVVQAPGTAEALFALLSAGAGAVLGLWWVLARPEEQDTRAFARLLGLLLGGCLGGVLARATGTLADLLLGVPAATDAVAVAAGQLSVPGVAAVAGVLLWPLATGALVFVDTVRDLVARLLPAPEAHASSRPPAEAVRPGGTDADPALRAG